MQTDKQINQTNLLDIVVVDMEQKRAVVIEIAVPNDSNTKKKE